MNAMQRVRIQGDGVELAAYCWGNAEGPPLLLVHGYPDNHAVWLPLIRELADHYRIIAYDVRGFGTSARPHTRRDYHLAKLANDLEAVINATSPDQPVHLVAHDWGSIQAWEAVTEPRIQPLLASYTSISGPCLDHVGHWMRERLRQKRPGALLELTGQLLSSWYIAFFHLPWLPELTWRLGLDKAWPRLLHRLEGIRHAAPNPSQRADGMHGVQLYRANFIRSLLRPRLRHTQVPVQLVVPTRDRFVRPQLFDQLERWAPDLRRRETKAGHWQLLAEPGQLAEWLRAFIAKVDAAQAQAPRRRTGS
ncbi:alpha/beta fold hydrolase [Pseudomonas sp. GD03944]|uniref:alpha/beta fold hydrolase n=1 Tax=Pseudomonas sp. GD03944 TaxID=2975409 RepID=UPI00244764D1|nr:alpha/beta fold hydrolase [Pseudomonas sp. GD03944]MDH1263490.1 alpha/beta fold hydrolase [Pseudomonas sp. GD03944]